MNIIKRLNSGQHSIASWFYDYITDEPEWKDTVTGNNQEDCFMTFIESTQQLLKILQKHDLFRIKKIVINDFRDFSRKAPDNWVKDQGMTFDVDNEFPVNKIRGLIKDKFHRFFFPDCIYFSGSTIIDTEDGTRVEYDGLFFIISDPGDYIRLTTDSDIWTGSII